MPSQYRVGEFRFADHRTFLSQNKFVSTWRENLAVLTLFEVLPERSSERPLGLCALRYDRLLPAARRACEAYAVNRLHDRQ